MTSASSWGVPSVPLPAPEQNEGPKGPARVRYVVQHVEQDQARSGEKETVWRVRVRQEQTTSGLTFVLYVAQRPAAPAPYAVGGLVALDPRLVDPDR